MKNKLLIILILILAVLTSCTTNESSTVQIEEGAEEKGGTNQEQEPINNEIQNNLSENQENNDSNATNENNESANNMENSSKINIENNNQPAAEDKTVSDYSNNASEQKATAGKTENTENKNNNIIDNETANNKEEKQESNILKIKGLVNKELNLSLDDLKSMNDIIYENDFYSLNSYGTTGYTHFKGVNLWYLLSSKAEIKDEAVKITVIAQDGYKMEFTVEQVKKQDYMDETDPDTKYPMIIAWEENGEEYDKNEGATYKLAVGQKEAGDVNKPQWVSNIDSIIVE